MHDFWQSNLVVFFRSHNRLKVSLWNVERVHDVIAICLCHFISLQSKFSAFKNKYEKTFNSDNFDYDSLAKSDYVFMRWKEHFLVSTKFVIDNQSTFAFFSSPTTFGQKIEMSGNDFKNQQQFNSGTWSHDQRYKWRVVCWLLLHLLSEIKSRNGRLLLSQIIWMVSSFFSSLTLASVLLNLIKNSRAFFESSFLHSFTKKNVIIISLFFIFASNQVSVTNSKTCTRELHPNLRIQMNCVRSCARFFSVFNLFKLIKLRFFSEFVGSVSRFALQK